MSAATAPLGERTLNALAWRFLSKFCTFGLRLVVLVVLARLVSVSAFGLINQALIVTGLAVLVSDIGMGPALTQRRELTRAHIRVAFTVSLLSGLLLMAAVWFGAPLAAAAFCTPEVIPVLRLTSSTCLLTALGATAASLLLRRLAFRTLFRAEFTAYFLGYAVVGVSLAWYGYGVWAVAWAAVAEGLLRAGLLYAACPHPVRPSLAPAETRQLFHFGGGATLFQIANVVALSSDNCMVGRQFGAAAQGLYARAYQLMALPISEISDVVSQVLFPTFAEIQNEPGRLCRASLASITLSALAVFPVLATLAIAAPELIVTILGPQWEGAVVPLQILCVGGFLRCIYNLGDSLARARGAVYALSWRHAVYALCVIGGSFFGSHWGLTGVAVGVVGALLVVYLLMAQLTIRLLGSSWAAFFSAQIPGLLFAACVVGCALPVTVLLRTAHLSGLLVLLGTLFSSFASALLACFLVRRLWWDPVLFETVISLLSRSPVVARFLSYCRPWKLTLGLGALAPIPSQEPSAASPAELECPLGPRSARPDDTAPSCSSPGSHCAAH